MHFSLTEDGVQVTLDNECNEGWNGDYDPDDPDDEKLLRFCVDKQREDGEWVEVDDASYCTAMPTDRPEPEIRAFLRVIMTAVKDRVLGDISVKKVCEGLSWVGVAPIEKIEAELARSDS